MERLSQGVTVGVEVIGSIYTRVDDNPGVSGTGPTAQVTPDVVVAPPKILTAAELFSVEPAPALQPQVQPEQPPPPQQPLPFADARADEAAAAFDHLRVADAASSPATAASNGMDTEEIDDYEEEENA